MELKHIDIANLAVSATNMRGVKKAPDLTNILPSVRARGVLVPLIVRRESCPEPADGGSPDTYEIIAGTRRYHAALFVAEENGGIRCPVRSWPQGMTPQRSKPRSSRISLGSIPTR